jgi:hypothetical protein
MRILRKNLVLLLGLAGGFAASISVGWAVDKDKGGKFTPPAIEAIQSKQTSDGVVIAALAYNTEEEAKTAFGKLHPYEYGILPVLVIVRNDSKGAVGLQKMRFEYISPSGGKAEAVPASDVRYARSPKRPNYGPGPIPGIRLKGKNPLENQVIEDRGFAAKMLPPGESAYGFVYFRSGHRPGSRLYITGLQDAASGKELFYFDIELD